MSTIKYVLYARKSTEGDKKQVQSIQAQIREMKAIAKRYDLNIIEIIEDEKSAKTPGKRPGFNRMIQLIERGSINGILTYASSRLARSPLESGKIAQLLQDEKVLSIRTVSREYLPDDNAIVMGVEASMDAQYIRDLRRDVKRGMIEKIMNGGISGQAPAGYLNVYGKKIIAPDPLRFELIRKAFDLVLAGETPQSVRHTMNNDWGYTTASTGNPISYAGIYRLLANPRYAGKVPDPYKEGVFYEANFPAMITAEEYDRVQRILGKKGKPRLCKEKFFVLRGMIRCGECGGGVSPQTKHKFLKDGTKAEYTYYRCNMKRQCSQKKSIREELLLKQTEELLAMYSLPNELYRWGKKVISALAEQDNTERQMAHKMRAVTENSLTKQLESLLDKFTKDLIDQEDYKSKRADIKKQLDNLLTKNDTEQQDIASVLESAIKNLDLLSNIRSITLSKGHSVARQAIPAMGSKATLLNGVLSVEVYPWLSKLINGRVAEINKFDLG